MKGKTGKCPFIIIIIIFCFSKPNRQKWHNINSWMYGCITTVFPLVTIFFLSYFIVTVFVSIVYTFVWILSLLRSSFFTSYLIIDFNGMCNEKIYTDKTLLLLQESLEQFFYIWKVIRKWYKINIVSFFRKYLLLGCVAFKKLSIIFVKNKKWLNIYIYM